MIHIPPRVKTLPPCFYVAERCDGLEPLAIAARLPRGSGVIYRDYAAPDRAAYAAEMAKLARRRGLVLLVAGDAALARAVGAAGLHLPEHRLGRRLPPPPGGGLVTAAVHSRQAILRAARAGVDAVLLSPVFATKSHPDARPIGPHRLARLLRVSCLPVYALGGIDATRARRLPPRLAGIAALRAFADQKFRRVPRKSTPARSMLSRPGPKRLL